MTVAFVTLAIVFAVFAVVLAIVTRNWIRSSAVTADIPVSASSISANAIESLADYPTPLAAPITWPRLLDEGSSDLSLERRFELVQRLAVIADDWTTPILRRAVHEEHEPVMLDALVDALVAKRFQ